MKKNIAIVSAAVLIVFVGVWYFTSREGGETNNNEDGAVAIVNGERISLDDFNELKDQVLRDQGVDPLMLEAEDKIRIDLQIADMLVSRTIMNQAVKNSNVSASDEEIETQLESIRNRFENQADYEAALVAEGLTEEKLREQVSTDLATQAYLEQELNFSSISATEEEVKAEYELSTPGEDVPPLEEVYGQVEEYVIQQKQQQLITSFMEDLRAEADVELLI